MRKGAYVYHLPPRNSGFFRMVNGTAEYVKNIYKRNNFGMPWLPLQSLRSAISSDLGDIFIQHFLVCATASSSTPAQGGVLAA